MHTVTNIQPKPVKRFGEVYTPEEKNSYNADILPKKSIRIYGEYKNSRDSSTHFDKVFKIGDRAEYDSYNLNYTGKIVGIGPKSVTIKDHGTKHRLTLHEFCWRNWDFDVERIARHNFSTAMTL